MIAGVTPEGHVCQTFSCLGNRKPGLRLESGRICVMDELVFCLPEKKWMSIFVHWGHLGTWDQPS
jgi:hypothetical protein